MELNKLIANTLKLIDKLSDFECNDKEHKRMLKMLLRSLGMINKTIEQANCKHEPIYINNCCLSYKQCKKCNKILSEVLVNGKSQTFS